MTKKKAKPAAKKAPAKKVAAKKPVAKKAPAKKVAAKKPVAKKAPVKKAAAKKPVAKKPAAKKAARRSTADVAKLRKSVIAGSKAKKTAETIAKELGISKAYVYALKRKA